MEAVGSLLPSRAGGMPSRGANGGLWDVPRGLCAAFGITRGEGAKPRGADPHSNAVTSGLKC